VHVVLEDSLFVRVGRKMAESEVFDVFLQKLAKVAAGVRRKMERDGLEEVETGENADAESGENAEVESGENADEVSGENAEVERGDSVQEAGSVGAAGS